MSTGEPKARGDESRPRERRRLRLIESYGAFSDDRLQEVAEKIRGITSDNDTQPTTLHGDTPLSSGEITESITQWITHCPSGETEGVKAKQVFEKTELISTNPQSFPAIASPNGHWVIHWVIDSVIDSVISPLEGGASPCSAVGRISLSEVIPRIF